MKSSEKKLERKWHIFDASKENFGRMSTQIATLLHGKHKVSFAPHRDEGDFVVVVNTDRIKFTGGKDQKKVYYSHSGYLGGLKSITLGDQIQKDSREVVKKAVFGMLPGNKLRPEMMKRLKLFKTAEHDYQDKVGK